MYLRPRLSFRTNIVNLFGIALGMPLSARVLLAQGEKVFQGQITQCACGRIGPADTLGIESSAPLCPVACSPDRTRYVLTDRKSNVTYVFDKEDLPRAYAGRTVFVIGSIDKGSRTIRVNNIVSDVTPKIRRAVTASVVCDACPRAMAQTRVAAYEELVGWGKFKIAPDPKSAEIVFLISANPYLGDYLTRDGPDKRPVHVETVYMDVLDSKTGQSLWMDSERVGSWFVVSAAKDLIDELRDAVESESSQVAREAFMARNHIYRVATNQGK